MNIGRTCDKYGNQQDKNIDDPFGDRIKFFSNEKEEIGFHNRITFLCIKHYLINNIRKCQYKPDI